MTHNDHHTHELFMRRALQLASTALGNVSPNPLVGSVVVHNGRIIGEGCHRHYGEAHAEVNAVQSVKNKELLKDSTVYVSLEPCSHHGKTPPCADFLVNAQIKKVVVANLDSNPVVSGNGIKKLQKAGIDVVTGVLEPEGRQLNRRFFTFMEKERPYIILKWAQTADGFIARENYDSKWISNEYSRQLVHKWRAEEDAILTGTRTAIHDNPQLNVRHWTGRNPVRVVIDRFLRISETSHLFDRSQKTICYNFLKNEESENMVLVRLSGEHFITQLVNDLYRKRIQSVLIEGGAQTLKLFIDAGLWDEARVFTSPKTFTKGIEAPCVRGTLVSQRAIMDDMLKIYTPA